MGGHITYEENTYSNVYAGPNYGGTVRAMSMLTYPAEQSIEMFTEAE